MPTPTYEERCIARFQSGDGQALEALFDMYADRALGLAVRLTQTREDAEEVAQEAFVQAFRRARQFRGESGTFGPWLFAIVRNLAHDKRRQLRLPVLPLDDTRLALLAGPHRTETTVEARADTLALWNALDALPEEWSTVLTLCDLEDVPHAQAALVLGRTTAATKSLLYRARRGLRDRLSQHYTETL